MLRSRADYQNVRFYGELAKFKVAKPYSILHVLKVFLDDFKSNIENISNLLETCGRFLLRYEGTAATAKSMVELMRRKQGNSHLDQRHQIMLENAFYTVSKLEHRAVTCNWLTTCLVQSTRKSEEGDRGNTADAELDSASLAQCLGQANTRQGPQVSSEAALGGSRGAPSRLP